MKQCILFIAYFYLLSCLPFCWNSAFSGKWPILDPCYYQLVILSNSSRVYHWITLWQGKWLQQERIFWTSGWNVCWQGRKNGSGILILWWVIFVSVNTTFVKYETANGSESKCNFFDVCSDFRTYLGMTSTDGYHILEYYEFYRYWRIE